MKNTIKKIMSTGILNSIALLIAAQSANQACMWFLHQPELPKEAERLKKH